MARGFSLVAEPARRDRHHARRRSAADVAGIIASQRREPRSPRRAQRRGRRARQPHGRVAGVGRIRRLLRRRARRRDRRRRRTAAAWVGAEAVHLRAGVRARLRAVDACWRTCPSHFPTAEPGVVYSPRNYDGRFRGPMRVRAALAGSENVPAVALASELGVADARALPASCGFHDVRQDRRALRPRPHARQRRGPARRARRGVRGVRARRRVRRSRSAMRGRTGARRPSAARHRAHGVLDRPTSSRTPRRASSSSAAAAASSFRFRSPRRPGTSQGYRDNWAVGYTRDVTVGVWVGNFDRAPLRNSSGVTGAGPIFHDVMLAAARRYGSAESGLSGHPRSIPGGTQYATPCARCPACAKRVVSVADVRVGRRRSRSSALQLASHD